MKFLLSALVAALSAPTVVFAAFGYTDNGSGYVIGRYTRLFLGYVLT